MTAVHFEAATAEPRKVSVSRRRITGSRITLGPDETREILADPEMVAAIREGEEDLAAGRVYTLQEVEAELRAAGRLK